MHFFVLVIGNQLLCIYGSSRAKACLVSSLILMEDINPHAMLPPTSSLRTVAAVFANQSFPTQQCSQKMTTTHLLCNVGSHIPPSKGHAHLKILSGSCFCFSVASRRPCCPNANCAKQVPWDQICTTEANSTRKQSLGYVIQPIIASCSATVSLSAHRAVITAANDQFLHPNAVSERGTRSAAPPPCSKWK